MPVIELDAVVWGLGGRGLLRTGRIEGVYWAGDKPYTTVVGKDVVTPSRLRVEIVNGVQQAELSALPTDGSSCVRWQITENGVVLYGPIYTTVPDVESVVFGDLPIVDPETFAPTDPTPTLIETIRTNTAVELDAQKGVPEGVAGLGADGVVFESQIPERLGEVALNATIVEAVAPKLDRADAEVEFAAFDQGRKIVVDYTATISAVAIPDGVTGAFVSVAGAGGGGGSGRRGAAGTVRQGGGGGGSGLYLHRVWVPLSWFDALTFDIIIGAGGSGGGARTTDNTDGVAGGTGGFSAIRRLDGAVVRAAGGPGGGGGTSGAGGLAGTPAYSADVMLSGGAASATGGVGGAAPGQAALGCSGGGAGGGITSGDIASAGGAGGPVYTIGLLAQAGGSVDGTLPARSTGYYLPPCSGGGGGGAASITAAAQAARAASGSTPGFLAYGNGGGGGGASLNGFNSGAGSAGSGGHVRIEWVYG